MERVERFLNEDELLRKLGFWYYIFYFKSVLIYWNFCLELKLLVCLNFALGKKYGCRWKFFALGEKYGCEWKFLSLLYYFLRIFSFIILRAMFPNSITKVLLLSFSYSFSTILSSFKCFYFFS